jgi:DNA-directed RNA polymerase specialized sigma24 family protein
MNLVQASHAHARGEIDFAEFAKHTGKLWSWWASRLSRRDVPSWLDEEDVRQELLVAAWRAADRWEESKGAKPATWIAQSAIRAARKSVMRARGVNRHTWRWDEPARHDVAIEDLESSVDAEQENDLLGRGVLLSLAEEHGPIAALVARALAAADGDAEIAGLLLYEDSGVRLLCRFGNEAQAVKLVRQWIKALAGTEGIDDADL